MTTSSITIEPVANQKKHREQSVHINKRKGKITGYLRIFEIKDGDYIVLYAPALNMTGYGDTVEKAREMIKEILSDYFDKIIKMKPTEIFNKLRKYGWSKSLFNKQYNNDAYVDKYGILKNFDMPENTEIKETLMQVA